MIVNTDVTERKVLEMQFLRAQRLESLGTLAGGIAHDLNNILGPILMSVQMLQMRPQDERSRKLLRTMERSTQRGADLVRQVLSFARGVKGERVAMPLKPLISELAKILKDTLPRSIQIRLAVANDLWTVEGDVTQLHQVLMNLCLNARDAMTEGGTLTVSASNIAVEEAYARLHVGARAGRYVLLEVADTGAGMSPEVQDKIFEPFFTTKEKGTGLGLSTALGIITGHGGFINVYSEEGRGTCFKIYLPASVKTTTRVVQQPSTGRQRGRGELVLVVDDERDFRDITRQLLEEHGYRVLAAADGIEALNLFRKHQHEIRVVITDIMMPAMDGRALICTLHKINPAVRIIAASGLSTNENLAETTGVDVSAFLPKPYETTKLLAALNHVVNEAATLVSPSL